MVPEPYANGSSGPAAAELRFARRFGFPDGFKHGMVGALDEEGRRRPLAWGSSAGTTSRRPSTPRSRASSGDRSDAGGGLVPCPPPPQPPAAQGPKGGPAP